MSQLFGILYRIRHFFMFLLLQIACFYLISKNSSYWDVTFFNSTNNAVAKTMAVSQSVKEFINLGNINEQLVLENKKLREDLTKQLEYNSLANTGYKPDSNKAQRYQYLVAKVISGTQNLTDNYITIDKGTKHGLKPGMGVICPQGVVGQVMSCNEEYSRVSTVLHSSLSVSAEILNNRLRKEKITALGIGSWPGVNSRIIKLSTVDRFKPISKGDSVVTSAQNSIFPANIMIGRISKINTVPNDAFFEINVRLSTDFSSLMYVYVVNNKLVDKQSQVEEITVEK
ncbi:MAG: rod shape-determining protein MreC [Bacteroidetes bacterium]|nr:rod shape-determining protein MreC [Bacteroidota bacterium]